MKCQLCDSEKRDDLICGEFLEKNGIGVHTYCLYLTSNLGQKGKDGEGFLGFLLKDIAAERRRVAKQHCCYCGRASANISCCKARCHRSFHLICGSEFGVRFQFINTFRSFCNRHVPKVQYRPDVDEKCCICYERLIGEGERFKTVTMLRAPCCRNGWFHRICLQRFSNTSGYFFKCPLCNDKDEFKVRMAFNGVFVQERDAEWELEPHAYEDLLERPSVCKAVKCYNSIGRAENDESDPLVLCRLCGSEARHQKCLPLNAKHFECNNCRNILGNDKESDNDEKQSDNHDSLDAHDREDEVINVESDSDESYESDESNDFLTTVLKAIEEMTGNRAREQNKQKQTPNEEHPCTSSTHELRRVTSCRTVNRSCNSEAVNYSNKTNSLNAIANRTRQRLGNIAPHYSSSCSSSNGTNYNTNQTNLSNVSCIANRTRRRTRHIQVSPKEKELNNSEAADKQPSKVKKYPSRILCNIESEDDSEIETVPRICQKRLNIDELKADKPSATDVHLVKSCGSLNQERKMCCKDQQTNVEHACEELVENKAEIEESPKLAKCISNIATSSKKTRKSN